MHEAGVSLKQGLEQAALLLQMRRLCCGSLVCCPFPTCTHQQVCGSRYVAAYVWQHVCGSMCVAACVWQQPAAHLRVRFTATGVSWCQAAYTEPSAWMECSITRHIGGAADWCII